MRDRFAARDPGSWNPLTLALLASLWLATAGNWPLWRVLLALPENAGSHGALFAAGFAAMVAALTFVLLQYFKA